MISNSLTFPPGARLPLSGWGRFPVQECLVVRPETTRSLVEAMRGGTLGSVIGRGAGRSYGDAALNPEGVISTLRLNRMIDLDVAGQWLECEAGVTFDDVLGSLIPRGWFLPVTPGTKFVTVGGAIASDVHGKNHHRDGSFGQHVSSLELLLPRGEIVRCSRDENSDLFRATLGGMGLTGMIVSAKFRLIPIETRWIVVERRRTNHLEETLAGLAEFDGEYRYSVAWVDTLASGRTLGRGVVMGGNHASRADAGGRPSGASVSRAVTVPFPLPFRVLNRATISAFNELYFRRHAPRRVGLETIDHFFYPLDGVRNWNFLYGRRGFIQYQFVLPERQASRGVPEILEYLARSAWPSFLAVLKRFGDGRDGLLSFPMKGLTLAIDLPAGRGVEAIVQELDSRVRAGGGRVYLAKDAMQSPETFREGYPDAREFQKIQAVADRGRRMNSTLARRLRLLDPGNSP